MKQPLDQFLEYLTYERMYSEKTIRAYRTDLEAFTGFAGERYPEGDPLELIDRKGFRAWLANLNRQGLGRSTIQRKISAVKTFFRFLNDHGIRVNTAYENLVAPKQEKRLPDHLTPGQVRSILDSVDEDSFTGKRDRAILELLYSTGVRLNELLSIKMNNLNFQRRTLKIRGKGSKDRIVPLGEIAIGAIRDYNSYRRTLTRELDPEPDELFLTTKGKPLYPMAVQRMVREKLYEFAGIYRLNPHIFRHSFATHMLDNGADIRAVKDLLGHESLATTQHYTHLSVRKLKSAYQIAHPRSEEEGDR